ncbi:MAG: L-rhamnose mutarotase [Clostridiales bacterium]|jgi:L-rhamnose mutarotase|nr:L-rhamnose mutarotase [Clostridiales bacterium]
MPKNMPNRYLMVIKVKPECRDEYVAIHKNPWREMLEALRDAGFVNELIWYYEDQSIIYLECDDHDACDARLRATEICKKWDMEMLPRFAAEPAMPEKIFDLREMLGGSGAGE